jgi:hypothetical protein
LCDVNQPSLERAQATVTREKSVTPKDGRHAGGVRR